MSAGNGRPPPSGWAQTDEALWHYYLEGHAVCGSTASHRVPYMEEASRPCAGCDRWVKAVDAQAAESSRLAGLAWEPMKRGTVRATDGVVRVTLRPVRPAAGIPQVGWRWSAEATPGGDLVCRVQLHGWVFNPLPSVGKLAALEGVRAVNAAVHVLRPAEPVLPSRAVTPC